MDTSGSQAELQRREIVIIIAIIAVIITNNKWPQHSHRKPLQHTASHQSLQQSGKRSTLVLCSIRDIAASTVRGVGGSGVGLFPLL